MKNKFLSIGAVCITFLLLTAATGQSCVGRILTISVNDTIEQKVIGQLLATYITERTGTTVNMKTAQNEAICREQIKQGETDIMINYLTVGLAGMDDMKTSGNDQEDYGLVKQYYVENFDIVWLKPLGYKGGVSNANGETVSLSVPVTSIEVLNRFPVVDRVIN
jgi:glycine betaine/choline ABC-type transport system substrate-binding protein